METQAKLLGLARRGYNHLNKVFARTMIGFLMPNNTLGVTVVVVGNGDGAWQVPEFALNDQFLCYCFGVGLDISFDVGLADRGCLVYSFDPTPRSIAFMQTTDYDRSRITFLPIGVWKSDTQLKFYAPMNRAHVNYSTGNVHNTTEYFLAECMCVSTIMRKFGHDRVGLIKLDIEGSWSEVLTNIVEEEIDVDVICVEFDTPVNIVKILRMVSVLRDAGFKWISRSRDNYLFVNKRRLSTL